MLSDGSGADVGEVGRSLADWADEVDDRRRNLERKTRTISPIFSGQQSQLIKQLLVSGLRVSFLQCLAKAVIIGSVLAPLPYLSNDKWSLEVEAKYIAG